MASVEGVTDTIASRRNPLVARCRRLARGMDDAWMLLEGLRLLEEAVRASCPIETIALTPRLLADPDGTAAVVARELARERTRVVTAPARVMAAMSPAAQPSGVVAIAARPRPDIDHWLSTRPRIVVAACDVQDPGNLGAMIRASHAAGAAGLVACGVSADPWGWKTLRGSMGSCFHLPVFTARDAPSLIARLRGAGIRIVATAPHGGRSPYDTDLPEPLALVVGGEAAGLADAVTLAADACVSLPMTEGVDSLNVSVATGILLYELVRRRSATR